MMSERMFSEAFSALSITSKLFYKSRSKRSEGYRSTYTANANSPREVPLITEDSVLADFLKITEERNCFRDALQDGNYWDRSVKYNPFEVYSLAIEFLDDHEEPLPLSVLPPEKDVRDYISRIFASKSTVSLDRQFNLLLEISHNCIAGAANVGLIASRLMARGSDFRAYPSFTLTTGEVEMWNNKIFQFETYGEENRNDGPGDTYYFWTHLFVAFCYSLSSKFPAKLIDGFFVNGTRTMSLVRKNIAHEPTITNHREASSLGRNIGLALSYVVQEHDHK